MHTVVVRHVCRALIVSLTDDHVATYDDRSMPVKHGALLGQLLGPRKDILTDLTHGSETKRRVWDAVKKKAENTSDNLFS